MPILRIRSNGTGRRVDWSTFKQGQLVDRKLPRLGGATTVLTDVVSDIHDFCHSLDSNCRLVTVIPNGFSAVTFNLAFICEGLEVTCTRRLVRGGFPFIFVAQEFGSNYDVVVTVNGTDKESAEKMVQLLHSTYQCCTVT